MLGPHRGASVRSAPTWPVLNSPAPGKRPEGLDAITAALFPRYCEVAREMAPYRQRTVFEGNPELTFHLLNGDRPLHYSKRFVAGQDERRALLEKRIPGVERILDARLPGVAAWHLNDAAACLWTARRILVRAVNRVPIDPEWDDQGLRMEIVW
jgi:predicted RNase H-like nuclease